MAADNLSNINGYINNKHIRSTINTRLIWYYIWKNTSSPCTPLPTPKLRFPIFDIAFYPVVIKNGNTCTMTTSAPQEKRHCRRPSDSSVLIFFWCRVAISWSPSLSFIFNFHNASSSIVVASISFGNSSSKWASFSRILCKIVE